MLWEVITEEEGGDLHKIRGIISKEHYAEPDSVTPVLLGKKGAK